MKAASRHSLPVEDLQGLYSVEVQLLAALPQMAEAASSLQLRLALEEQEKDTKENVVRLEQVIAYCNALPESSVQLPEMLVEDSGKGILQSLGISAVKQLLRHCKTGAILQ